MMEGSIATSRQCCVWARRLKKSPDARVDGAFTGVEQWICTLQGPPGIKRFGFHLKFSTADCFGYTFRLVQKESYSPECLNCYLT
jgi:hypothetical protein